MRKVDLNAFSIDELKKLSKDIETTMTRKKEEERKNALKEVHALLATKYGLTLGKLLSEEKVIKRGKVQPKYYNPDNPRQLWSGRGKRPRWVEEKLAEGMTLAELEI